MNLVTAHQTSTWWVANGGAAALASAIVTVYKGPPFGGVLGQIYEGDIALNANALVGSQKAYGWVEWNDSVPGLAGWLLVSEFLPFQSFVDIEGVVAHEAGHVAGLGHSVIDSEASSSGSTFPTMFPIAQVRPFEEGAATFGGTGTCVVQGNHTVSGAGTVLGGIVGISARTLELDDLAAIARGYPAAGFGSLATIQGNVRTTSGPNADLAGHAVIAINADCPQLARVQTFAYTTPLGQYTLSGLPPGTYYVAVERVDQGTGPPSTYFRTSDVPNFIGPFTYPPATPCSSPNWTDFNGIPTTSIYREFRNTPESNAEFVQLANPITVAAGQVVSGIDFDVRRNPQDPSLNPRLEVGLQAGPYSMKGIQVASSSPTVEIRVSWDGPHAGWDVALHLAHNLNNSDVAGQLLEVAVVSGSGVPGTVSGTLSSSGGISFTLSPASVEPLRNVWIQAQVFPPGGGPPVLTNPVNIWVNRP